MLSIYENTNLRKIGKRPKIGAKPRREINYEGGCWLWIIRRAHIALRLLPLMSLNLWLCLMIAPLRTHMLMLGGKGVKGFIGCNTDLEL